jgi:hypothetical protein
MDRGAMNSGVGFSLPRRSLILSISCILILIAIDTTQRRVTCGVSGGLCADDRSLSAEVALVGMALLCAVVELPKRMDSTPTLGR